MAVVDVIPQLQTKSMTTYGVVTIDEEQGIVEAYVSGIGNKDHVADIIEPGAFVDSLKERKPKGVWSHNWDRPISKTLEIYEVSAGDSRLPMKMKEAGIGGLYVKTQFNLDTQDGRDSFSNVKFFGDEGEWSIGYQVDEAQYDSKVKANRLKKISLYEYSPVLFGANSLTGTVGVKQMANGKMKVQFEGVDEEMATKIAEVIGTVAGDVEVDEKTDVEPEDGSEVAPVEQKADEVEETAPEAEVKTKSDEEEVEPEVDPEGASSEAPAAEETAPVEEEEKGLEASPIVSWLENSLKGVDLTSYDAKLLTTIVENRVRDEKVIPGSFEDIRRKVEKALDDEYSAQYVYVHSVFDSKVVYCIWMGDERKCFQASYAMTDDGVKISDVTEVDVIEVVVAKHALIDAAYKGHGAAVKALLRPLVEAAEDEPLADDDYTKGLVDALQSKVGATISSANQKKLSTALETIETAVEDIEAIFGINDDAEEAADEASGKSAEGRDEDGLGGDAIDTETKSDEAGVEADLADVITIDLADFEEFKSLI